MTIADSFEKRHITADKSHVSSDSFSWLTLLVKDTVMVSS